MKVQRQIAYIIVEGDNPQELAIKVQAMAGQGFLPSGGISVSGTVGLVGTVKFYQPMTFINEIPIEDDVPDGPRLVQS